MALLRVQVVVRDPTNPDPKNDVVNVFYLDDLAVPGGAQDYTNLANDTRALWEGFRPYPGGANQCEVRIYKMSDAKPRPIVGRSVGPITSVGDGGPREVALCLSFYGTRNLPRQRGRLFIGPFRKSDMDLRPSFTVQNTLKQLAIGIGNLGGADVDWQVYSPTGQLSYDVTNYWIDDEWDTQRRRGLKGTSRIVGTTAG